MKFPALHLCLLLLPALGFAKPPLKSCVADSKSEIFGEYESLSDEEIGRRCTYDIQKHEPDADESRVKANVRRTSICEKGLTKMREISQRYMAKKQEVCLKAQNAPTCADASSQASCVADAGNLAAEVEKGQEELSAIMLEGKEKIESISRFNRLLTSKFKHQQRELGRMPVEEKNRLLPPVKSISHPHADTKPTPNPVEKPISQNPPDSGITSGKTPGQTAEIPRTSGITSPEAPSYDPPADLRPQDYGARTWAEYERKLPLLIQQNENTAKQLQKFEESRVAKHSEHRVAASEMAVKAAEFYATAEKLGYAGEDLTEWKKENPSLEKKEASPAAPTASLNPALPAEEASEEAQAPAELFFQAKKIEAKEEVDARGPAAIGSPESGPSDKEEQALSSFDSKLRDEAKTPAAIAERSRLRDLLRRRMQAREKGEATDDLEKVPGSFVGDILAETKAFMGRAPDSEGEQKKEIGTVDVEGALRDMEAQLQELDRQHGILEANSPSLFERVKARLKNYGKSLK